MDIRVLLVEDDRKIAANLVRGLQADGMSVTVSHDGAEGLQLASRGGYDVVLLDILLPGRNGYQVCADLRERGDTTPILMLTAKDGEYDEAEGLDTGADDYVTKPFNYMVLVARIRALARRARAGARDPIQPAEPVVAGDLRVEPAARRVWRGSQEVQLTPREFDVLAHLCRHQGQVVSKQQLLDGVWDQAYDGDPNIVEVYVSRLRRRLGDEVVRTVRGLGYRLDDGRR